MFKKVVTRRISLMLAMVMMLATLCTTTAFAATPSYGVGEHYLGQFTFTDSNTGAKRTYNANMMRIKIAWKKGEWYPASDIDMYIRVYRDWNNQTAFSKRFTPADDTDGVKDADGYYYAVSNWFSINNGSDYRIYYEAFTTAGATGTGSNRMGNVHTWIELAN